jgi:hypothetical protein
LAGVDGSVGHREHAKRIAPRVAEPELLERVLAELRGIARQAGLERTLAVGELILTQFFGGDAAAWQDRRRNKNNSIRRLADREDCPFSKSALHEAVAVYVASLDLPCVRTLGHIGSAHVVTVMGLPPAAREPTLLTVQRERLSVRELRRRVVGMRRAEGERRGRPAHDSSERIIAETEALVTRLLSSLSMLPKPPDLDPAARKRLEAVALRLLRAVEGLRPTSTWGPTVKDADDVVPMIARPHVR